MKKIDTSKKIILDADVVIHFINADKLSVLPGIFKNKLYMPDMVFEETFHGKQKSQVHNLFIWGMVHDLPITLNTNKKVFLEYIRLKNKEGYGKGESACMAYCRYNNDVIASSNLKDIKSYCQNNNITYLTTMDFLEEALHNQTMSLQECDQFITDVLAKGSKLPSKSMADYAKSKQK